MIMKRLDAWLPPGRASRRFVAASFVNSVGTGLFLAGSALFFTRDLGLTTGQVGIGLTLSGIAGLIGMVPIGGLADQIGGKWTLVALSLWRGAGFVAYTFVGGPGTFFAVAFLIGVAEWSVGPVVQAVVGALDEGGSRVRTMAAIASVRNVGFTIGALLATLTVATGSTRLYSGLVLADAATFFAVALLLSRLPVPVPVAAPEQRPGGRAPRVRDLRYLALTALNGLLYLHSVVLTVGLPLWIVTRTAAPKTVAGAVLVVNTVIAIVFQVPLSRGADDARHAARRQHWAGLSLAGCCLLIALTTWADGAVAAVLVLTAAAALTLGEIWQSVGAWGLSYSLSPTSRRAYYLSVYNLGLTGASVVGPVLVTFAVIRIGAAGWLGLAAVFALAGLSVVLVAHGAQGRPASTERKEPSAAPRIQLRGHQP